MAIAAKKENFALGKSATPYLAKQSKNRARKARGVEFFYDEEEHRLLPHIVKFSGGRSSGMMLVHLLKNGILRSDRGDVVLFTNTSAEHRKTYNFIAKMKIFSESYGIPFHIIEFQTYETVKGGGWVRQPSYRLAHLSAVSHRCPQGISTKGEVFEEMVAWLGMLPSVHTRVCTSWMKLFPTRAFLSDWLACRETLSLLGHKRSGSMIGVEEAYARYICGRGQMSKELFLTRYMHLAKRPTFRPAQRFADFTIAPPSRCNAQLEASVAGGKCELFGDRAARFITMLGFRADETWRYIRMGKVNRGEETPRKATQPLEEYSYAPLFTERISKKDVMAFWRKQPKDLRPSLPESVNLSNCVYCFMKGQGNLAAIEACRRSANSSQQKNTPESMNWWVRIEETYRRRSRNGQAFGFLGKDHGSYRELREKLRTRTLSCDQQSKDFASDADMVCECTD